MKPNEFHNIIGDGEITQELLKKIDAIAQSDAHAIIYAEPGTSREFFAREIHSKSSRSAQAFVPVDCLALPEELLENMLFGYERRSILKAKNPTRGLLEYANHGTLFLDEIGKLSPNLQQKLSQVLKEGRFHRISSNKSVKVDLRIISTSRLGSSMIRKSGVLNEELWHQLSAVTLQIPPLRTRKEDIPLLVKYYVGKFTKTDKSRSKVLDTLAIEALQNYSWPGDVRELKEVIASLVSILEKPRTISFIKKPVLEEAISLSRKQAGENGSEGRKEKGFMEEAKR